MFYDVAFFIVNIVPINIKRMLKIFPVTKNETLYLYRKTFFVTSIELYAASCSLDVGISKGSPFNFLLLFRVESIVS